MDTGRRVDGGRAEQEGDLGSLLGQRMGVEFSIAGEEFVGFDLAQVVAELVKSVVVFADVQDGQDGLVEVPGAPFGDQRVVVQGHLDKSADARADRSRKGKTMMGTGSRRSPTCLRRLALHL